MTVAIYSAIYGGYESAKPIRDLGIPAIMYTDNRELHAPGWTVRHVPHEFATNPDNGDPAIVKPMLAHKYWKCHPQDAVGDLGVDTSIWLDGSMEVTTDDFVNLNLAALGEDDWACVRHPWRDCVYTEAEFSATLIFRYDGLAISRQSAYYRRELGHPERWGLFATGHNVRRHTPDVLALGKQWWNHNLAWSHQDQLSLPVLMRLYADVNHRVRYNYNLPWWQWWTLHPHGY